MIRPVEPADSGALAQIYNHYILDTPITFEEEAVDAVEMARRVARVTPEYDWLVAENGGRVVGYAYLHRWHERAAYRHTAETSIYLAPGALGSGAGTQLLSALLKGPRCRALHVLVAGIALPNPASVRLHEKFGFKQVAHFHQVGRKFDRWIDVGHWELLL